VGGPMKQTAIAVLLFLVTLAGALWLLGAFRSDEPTGGEVGRIDAPPTSTPDLQGAEPRDEPKPEVPQLPAVVHVLVLGETSRSFTEWLYMTWDYARTSDGAPGVAWQAWYGAPASTGVRTQSEGLPALEHAPLAPDLEGVSVLVLAGVDPKRLAPEFWARVAERVKAGSLGLLVLPESAHVAALAAEPSLASILPVTGVRGPVPTSPGSRELAGVFDVERPFVATTDGTVHPATRLVPYAGWSAKLWAASAKGAGAWGTKFCPQVAGPAAGARVLLQVDAGTTKLPAVVASAGDAGRVLWVGGLFDVGLPAYKDSASFDRIRALSIAWILWLSGARA
jgi:hypothetical protein